MINPLSAPGSKHSHPHPGSAEPRGNFFRPPRRQTLRNQSEFIEKTARQTCWHASALDGQPQGGQVYALPSQTQEW